MHNISIISTQHSEIGACTTLELLKIFERINPDVIFEEIPPSRYNFIYYVTDQKGLETEAVKLFIQKKNIPHIPIDIDYQLNNEEFWKDVDIMLYAFNENNIEYSNNNKIMKDLVAEKGFSYLNSDECVKILERQEQIEIEQLKKWRDDKMLSIYRTWKDLHFKREVSWVYAIYGFCRQLKFLNAILYCGVQHSHSVFKRIPKMQHVFDIEINWKFNDLPD